MPCSLQLATKMGNGTLEVLLNELLKIPNKDKRRNLALERDSYGQNIFDMAFFDQPLSIKPLIAWIAREETLHPTSLLDIYCAEMNELSSLMLSDTAVLEQFFNLLLLHCPQRIPHVLRLKDEQGMNVLMLAARHSDRSCALILKIVKEANKTDPTLLKDLLTVASEACPSAIEAAIACKHKMAFVALWTALIELPDHKDVYLLLSSDLFLFNLIFQYITTSTPKLLPGFLDLLVTIDSPEHQLTKALFADAHLQHSSFLCLALKKSPESIGRLLMLVQQFDISKRIELYIFSAFNGKNILHYSIRHAPQLLNVVTQIILSEANSPNLMAQLACEKDFEHQNIPSLLVKNDLAMHSMLMLINHLLKYDKKQSTLIIRSTIDHLTAVIDLYSAKYAQLALKLLELTFTISEIADVLDECQPMDDNHSSEYEEYYNGLRLHHHLKQCLNNFTDRNHSRYQDMTYLIQEVKLTRYSFKSSLIFYGLYEEILGELGLLYNLALDKPQVNLSNPNQFFAQSSSVQTEEALVKKNCCVVM